MNNFQNPERIRLVESMKELGSVFSERADKYDSEASFPYENFADLKDAGFLALCIPEDHGGMGADFVTYALISEELGRHCGSTALTFNMHTASMLLTGQISDDLEMSSMQRKDHAEKRSLMWKGVVESGHIHAQPFSEGHQAGEGAGISSRAVPVEGGFRVTGKKIFASLSEAADRHNITCLVEGEEEIRFLGTPAGSDGLKIEGGVGSPWDARNYF